MLPTSNQPWQLYGTAKAHNFDNTADITEDNLSVSLHYSSVWDIHIQCCTSNCQLSQAAM